MTRAHVKLLGPCFKTGRMERSTITTPENESERIPPNEGRSHAQRLIPAHRISAAVGVLVEHRRVGHRVAQARQQQPTPHRALDWPPTCCGGEREESRHAGHHSQHRERPPEGNCQPGTVRRPSPLECPSTHGLFHPFTSEQFHALLNSLFKVLFNFPSRYLFAIGLACIFSLGWGLPPI